MKIILKICCFLIVCIFLSGCSSTNTIDEETYFAITTYRQKVGKKFNYYINNDKSISPREKNTFETYERLFDLSISKIKIEK